MGLALDEPNADESTTPINGLDVLIEDDVRQLADETTIDYITETYGEGFVIEGGGLSSC